MTELTTTPTEQEILVASLKRAAADLSYYNAAEGQAWYKEEAARAHARRRFSQAVAACKEAGIDTAPHLVGYMVGG